MPEAKNVSGGTKPSPRWGAAILFLVGLDAQSQPPRGHSSQPQSRCHSGLDRDSNYIPSWLQWSDGLICSDYAQLGDGATPQGIVLCAGASKGEGASRAPQRAACGRGAGL